MVSRNGIHFGCQVDKVFIPNWGITCLYSLIDQMTEMLMRQLEVKTGIPNLSSKQNFKIKSNRKVIVCVSKCQS